MPRAYEMSWVKTRKRWEKMYKGQRFVVSPRQLGVADSKEESATAANEWWRKKRAEIDAASLRTPKPLDELVGALYEPRLFTNPLALMTHAGSFPPYLQQALEQLLTIPLKERTSVDSPAYQGMLESLRRVTTADLLLPLLLDGKPLPGTVAESLPQPRLQEIEQGARQLRGETVIATERTVRAHAEHGNGFRQTKWRPI